MKFALGSDHTGYDLKQLIKMFLVERGDEVQDLGTYGPDLVDYPDYAEAVAAPALAGHMDRAVLICSSGVGASVAANKIPGIRAGSCHDTYSANQGVEHDKMNILVLGGRVIGQAMACELVLAFAKAKFTDEQRHVGRFAKVRAIEQRYTKTT